MAGIDDEVPPLEDMSDLLQQVHQIHGNQKPSTGNHGNQKPSTVAALQTNSTQQVSRQSLEASKVTTDTQQNGVKQSSRPTAVKEPNSTGATPKPKATSSSSGTFGGMKKGFLFASSSKPKSTKKSTKPSTSSVASKSTADIPLIKPKVARNESNKQHEIAEVQEAMKASTPLLQNTDWVTDDLLKKLDQHPRLLQQLSDPRISQAMTKFQRNPQLAMQEYQHNPEIQQFFRDFCGILGSHFESLGNAADNSESVQTAPSSIRTQNRARTADISVHSSTNPKQATAADEAKMMKIMSDPEIREILQDEKIQRLFTALKSNPQEAQRLLATLDIHRRDKVQRLVDAGLLGFAR